MKLKIRNWVTVVMFGLAVSGFSNTAFGFLGSEDPATVAEVDFSRYSGFWYEIAHSPNFFQNDCKYSTAEYGVMAPGQVSVHNVCHKEDGTTRDIRGVAKVVDPSEPAKLKVRFNFFARGDYWIVRLDPDYQWAVVSGPGRQSIFILARQAPMRAELLKNILDDLAKDGYDINSLIFDRY